MKCYRIHTINKLNDIDFLIVVIHTSVLLTAHLNKIFYAYIHTYKHTYIHVDLGRASFVIDQLNFGRLRKSAWSIRSGYPPHILKNTIWFCPFFLSESVSTCVVVYVCVCVCLLQVTNILSFGISFFGFSMIVHRLGVRSSLLIFPR